MPTNVKHNNVQTNTYLMASTLMQKLMMQKTKNINYQNQRQRLYKQQSSIKQRSYKQSGCINNEMGNMNEIDMSSVGLCNDLDVKQRVKINIQYEPLIIDKRSNLNKLRNTSKVKPFKQIQSLSTKQKQSKMLNKIKNNIIHVYNSKSNYHHQLLTNQLLTKQLLINQQLTKQLLTNDKIIYQKKKENILFTQVQQTHNHQYNQNYYKFKANSYPKQASPHKVSVNFQLFFPKQKLRTTINTKPTAKHSFINVDQQFFRIKKSSKSISLTQQQKSTQLQKKKLFLQKSQCSQQKIDSDILVSLRKNSNLKYYQKVQKFKKYKDNQISKQPLFGLNVTQAQYHGLNIQNQFKIFNPNKQLKLQKQLSTNKTQSNSNQYEIQRLPQVVMNVTMSQGASLSMNNRNQDPQQTVLLANEQQSISPHKQKKYPSQQKITKNFFGPIELQRKKILLKNKFQQDIWAKQKLSFKGKLKSMLECMDILLNSYCCRLSTNETEEAIFSNKSQIKNQKSLQIQDSSSKQIVFSNIKDLSMTLSQPFTYQKKQKYLFYVGNGNNKNLIRSIMKKRGWWNETQNIQVANFVWSQLKIIDVLSKQEKMCSKIIQQPDSWNFKVKQDQKTALLKPGKFKTLPNRNQDILISQNYLKIFHKQMLPIYSNKLSQKQKQFRYLRSLFPSNLIHNHYDANYMLGNKKALFYNVLQYCTYKKVSPNTIIPLTFHIQSTQSRQFKNFLKTSKKFKNTLWIVKPGQNSNRGNGIFVEKDVQKIKVHIEKNQSQKHSFIVQKYLKNIFLYNKRKFDIRVYMLMSTIGGITKFFWYEEGYIRTSSEIYNCEDIKDLFIHLTNDAIQSKNQTYSKYQKGNKVSYTQFQRYLDSNYLQEKYSVQQLVGKMKSVAEVIVKSTYFKLDKAKKVNGFQLFGLDFLVDKEFNPWLLQVNTNPCLELSSPVLQRLIPRMLENMFRLTIDPIFRPNQNLSRHSTYFLYDNVFETNKFQLIFDSLFDSNFEWEEICLKQKNVIYEDQDQLFESNGVEVQVVGD